MEARIREGEDEAFLSSVVYGRDDGGYKEGKGIQRTFCSTAYWRVVRHRRGWWTGRVGGFAVFYGKETQRTGADWNGRSRAGGWSSTLKSQVGDRYTVLPGPGDEPTRDGRIGR